MGNCSPQIPVQNKNNSDQLFLDHLGQDGEELSVRNLKIMRVKNNNICFKDVYVTKHKQQLKQSVNDNKHQIVLKQNQKQNIQKNQSNLSGDKPQNIKPKKNPTRIARNTQQMKIKIDFLQLKEKRAIDEYKLLSKLQSKRVGQIYKVLDRKTKQYRTLQIIKQSSTNSLILNEIQILKSLDHPCIFHLYDLFKNKDNFYIVGEYVKGQNLLQILNLNNPYTQRQLSELIHQILIGLNYLHNCKVMHLNLKPQNILFQTKYNHKSQSFPPIKIVNFKKAKIGDSFMKQQILGNINFMAPQMLMGGVGVKCDIWSLGVILYYFVTGEFPFQGNSKEQVKNKILNHQLNFKEEIWRNKTPQLIQLIDKMLQKKPAKRISANDALASKWFENARQSFILTVSPQTMKHLTQNIGQSKFRTLIKTYIVSMTTSQQQRKIMSDKFQHFDKDNSGFIDKSELQQIFIQIFGDQEEFELDELMNQIDTNHSGKIDFTQFMTAISKVDSIFSKVRLQKAFDYIDYDHTGQIQANELVALFKNDIQQNEMQQAQAEIQQILNEFDNNGDCMISKDEFTTFFLRLKKKVFV